MTITPDQLLRWAKALEPFAGVPAQGKHGGPFVIASARYEDMSAKDSAPRAAYMHWPDFKAARAAKAEIDALLGQENQEDNSSQCCPAVAFEAGDWPAPRPMESAPLDTAILTYGFGYEVAHFNTALHAWVSCWDHRRLKTPLRWWPLPSVKPPSDGAERANWVGSGMNSNLQDSEP